VFRENDLDSAPYKDRNGEENTQAVDYPLNVKGVSKNLRCPSPIGEGKG